MTIASCVLTILRYNSTVYQELTYFYNVNINTATLLLGWPSSCVSVGTGLCQAVPAVPISNRKLLLLSDTVPIFTVVVLRPVLQYSTSLYNIVSVGFVWSPVVSRLHAGMYSIQRSTQTVMVILWKPQLFSSRAHVFTFVQYVLYYIKAILWIEYSTKDIQSNSSHKLRVISN